MSTDSQAFQKAHELAKKLQEHISQTIFGQEELIREALCAFLASGHLLITGAPGLAKTTLVRVLARSLGLKFGRVQFTPDLLPSDIIGCDILNIDEKTYRRSFEFVPGPMFVNLLLADEINRASPRTQSAMLESMQERKATVGGRDYMLPLPFMVFATQNPFESEGTFPLPEAQLDRFLLHALVEYPHEKAELQILQEHTRGNLVGEKIIEDGHRLESHKSSSTPQKASILDHTEVMHVVEEAKKVKVEDEVLAGILELVRSSRPQDVHCPQEMKKNLWYGAGPRAALSLVSAGKALALFEGEERLLWRHVKRLCKPAMRHRIRMFNGSDRDRLGVDAFIEELLQRLEERHVNLARGVGL
ncbi:MAG: AAA family ATPase [Oligoflexales bacterium]|nr:AAA family ATPase [Oligoflexales bacterium]